MSTFPVVVVASKEEHPPPNDEDHDRTTKKLPLQISFKAFFDPNSPWVLVHDGSLMGYFDWVPSHLRVGPWSRTAPVYLLAICLSVFYLEPPENDDDFDLNDKNTNATKLYGELYTVGWYYNLAGFLWTSFILYLCLRQIGTFIFCTYTGLSWTLLTLRHFLSTLLPALVVSRDDDVYDASSSWLVHIHQILRFPVLVQATITFLVWNFCLVPFILIYGMKDKQKRRDFVKWCFNFKMTQLHLCNVILAIGNTIVFQGSPQEEEEVAFTRRDLWYAYSGGVMYGMFYVLILDRLGCHLYPIFSPRSIWFSFTWSALLASYYATHFGWNRIHVLIA